MIELFSRPRLLALGIAIVCAATGCGGSGSHAHSSHTPTGPPPLTALTETVSSGGIGGEFATSAGAVPGSGLVFRTFIPGSPSAPRTTVEIVFPRRPESVLVVSASAEGHSAHATVHSLSRNPITLVRLHYTCEFPPTSTFCPLTKVVQTPSTTAVQFVAQRGHTVEITADAGPLPPALRARPAGSVVVPAYSVIERVALTPPGAGAQAPAAAPTEDVNALPGDLVKMVTEVRGNLKGARQPITISFDKGPSAKLTVTAKVPGGKPAHATITSTHHSPIVLTGSQYTCFVDPTVTFCPPTDIKSTPSELTVTFAATPAISPIEILARVTQA